MGHELVADPRPVSGAAARDDHGAAMLPAPANGWNSSIANQTTNATTARATAATAIARRMRMRVCLRRRLAPAVHSPARGLGRTRARWRGFAASGALDASSRRSAAEPARRPPAARPPPPANPRRRSPSIQLEVGIVVVFGHRKAARRDGGSSRLRCGQPSAVPVRSSGLRREPASPRADGRPPWKSSLARLRRVALREAGRQALVVELDRDARLEPALSELAREPAGLGGLGAVGPPLERAAAVRRSRARPRAQRRARPARRSRPWSRARSTGSSGVTTVPVGSLTATPQRALP